MYISWQNKSSTLCGEWSVCTEGMLIQYKGAEDTAAKLLTCENNSGG